ncbi:MAG: helix-turn-helix domain-containing protein, partial [Thermocrispum sp.]
KEFELLRLLMTHADHVVTTEQIREALWGSGPTRPSRNAVTVHVRRLRERLGGAEVLRTVRGLGYRLTLPDVPGERPGSADARGALRAPR